MKDKIDQIKLILAIAYFSFSIEHIISGSYFVTTNLKPKLFLPINIYTRFVPRLHLQIDFVTSF